MTKIIIASLFALVCLTPSLALAQTGLQTTGSGLQTTGSAPRPVPVTATGKIENPLKGAASLGELFKTISQFVLDLAYIVIAAFLLLSGFKFIKAQGNPEELAKAKATFWYTIIGAFIIIAMDTMVGVFKKVLEQLGS